MSGSLVSRFRGLWKRRYYLWSRISRPQVPVHTLSWLPGGFALKPLADTGITLVEGFAAAAELAQLEAAETERACIYRAAILSGQPDGFIEQSAVVELSVENPEHVFAASEGFCVCIFATAAQLGIEIDAQRITIAAEPGRAIGWPAHAKAVCRLGADNPVAKIRVLQYSKSRNKADAPVDSPRQIRTGKALSGDEVLPEGVWAPGADYLEAKFGKPDFLTKLIND